MNTVRSAAASATPAITQISQAGKSAPAISTTGSQPTASKAASASAASGSFAPIRFSVGIRNRQFLRREKRYHLASIGRNHQLLFDSCGRETVARRAIGLQREHHPGLDLGGLLERVQPADERTLVQREAEAVRELQAECGKFALEAELLRLGQSLGDLVAAGSGLDQGHRAVHPFARLGVGVALRRGGASDVEGAVVAGPVTGVGLDDVEEGLVAGADDAIGEVVRMGAAALAADRVDRLDVVRTKLVEHAIGFRDEVGFAHARLQFL